MRQSNKRSRSKQNRPRSLGNIVNRVFDSSGPEGKVRGTPQQIIDKYLVLTRDAQLAGDRVAAENFAQHAEHYTRMLHEAQAEMAREAEARREHQQNQQQNQNRRADSDGEGVTGQGNQSGGQNGQNNQGGNDRRRNRDNRDDRRKGRDNDDPRGEQRQDEQESTLVETPESRADRQQSETSDPAPQADAPATEPVKADDAPAPKKRGRPRKPKPSEDQPVTADTAEAADVAQASDRDAAE